MEIDTSYVINLQNNYYIQNSYNIIWKFHLIRKYFALEEKSFKSNY